MILDDIGGISSMNSWVFGFGVCSPHVWKRRKIDPCTKLTSSGEEIVALNGHDCEA